MDDKPSREELSHTMSRLNLDPGMSISDRNVHRYNIVQEYLVHNYPGMSEPRRARILSTLPSFTEWEREPTEVVEA